MRRSKNTSKLRATGLCAGNSPVTGEFPAQMASNAENVSIDDVIMGDHLTSQELQHLLYIDWVEIVKLNHLVSLISHKCTFCNRWKIWSKWIAMVYNDVLSYLV